MALFGPHTLGNNPLARLLRLVRYPYALLRDLLNGELNLRATGLVYATLLALIPAVALTFAVLKAFGAHRELEPLILEFFRPIGDEAAVNMTRRLMQFADGVRGGLVGVVGFGALLWTLIGTVKRIEDSINFVWRVRSARSIPRRIAEFAVLIIVGPLVIAAVIAFTKMAFDSVAMHTPHGFAAGTQVLKAVIVLAPYAIVTGLFTVMYLLLPNTRVKLLPALVGGVVAGLLWAATGKLFTTLVLASSQMKLVYAGFAIIAALIVWTYLGWLILLIGAQLAFYVQNPNYLRLGHAVLRLSSRGTGAAGDGRDGAPGRRAARRQGTLDGRRAEPQAGPARHRRGRHGQQPGARRTAGPGRRWNAVPGPRTHGHQADADHRLRPL